MSVVLSCPFLELGDFVFPRAEQKGFILFIGKSACRFFKYKHIFLLHNAHFFLWANVGYLLFFRRLFCALCCVECNVVPNVVVSGTPMCWGNKGKVVAELCILYCSAVVAPSLGVSLFCSSSSLSRLFSSAFSSNFLLIFSCSILRSSAFSFSLSSFFFCRVVTKSS